ncbi:hypothetical protein CUJ83_00370 [Methanocella sp. CWC-04]|uniref:Uncharacterized protein n=1 Tax=Methanooceanicella nereidis TaxID=2052831 RepID=A0AAP2RAI1_9EURY|nr:hypothetical protein [Methanocella sp. CWC-04]MCD1293452.1 hypothetical protein [Methanocella sp. CWC-04]
MDIKNKLIAGVLIIIIFLAAMVALQYFTSNNSGGQASDDGQVADVANVNWTLDQSFDKNDLIYGPQAWKPYNTKLPIVPGQNVDGGGDFYLMFVDLNTSAGISSESRTIRVDYGIKDLAGTAAFHAYGYSSGGISWTNNVDSSCLLVSGTVSGSGTQAAAKSLEENNNVYVKVVNDEGARYDDQGNDTYFIKFQKPGGGLNNLHVTNDAEVFGGQVTSTGDLSGTFYITYSGDRGLDDIILLVAVNGTIPDGFQIKLKAGAI